MAELIDSNHYEVINPQTGNREVWTGERIEAYKVNYGAQVAMPPKKKSRKKKLTDE